jgi:hypothetical protein
VIFCQIKVAKHTYAAPWQQKLTANFASLHCSDKTAQLEAENSAQATFSLSPVRYFAPCIAVGQI